MFGGLSVLNYLSHPYVLLSYSFLQRLFPACFQLGLGSSHNQVCWIFKHAKKSTFPCLKFFLDWLWEKFQLWLAAVECEVCETGWDAEPFSCIFVDFCFNGFQGARANVVYQQSLEKFGDEHELLASYLVFARKVVRVNSLEAFPSHYNGLFSSVCVFQEGVIQSFPTLTHSAETVWMTWSTTLKVTDSSTFPSRRDRLLDFFGLNSILAAVTT